MLPALLVMFLRNRASEVYQHIEPFQYALQPTAGPVVQASLTVFGGVEIGTSLAAGYYSTNLLSSWQMELFDVYQSFLSKALLK